MVARQTPNLKVGVQVLYGLPKIILDKSGNVCYSIYMMRKDSIQKHFQVFLKSAAWSKDWKPKSHDVLPSSLFSAHYFDKYPQAKKYFPHVQ